jgi:phosphate transport system substrate-binding protein
MTGNNPSGSKINLNSINVSIIMGGSTFINPQMQAWIQKFSSKFPNILVTYQSVGSGAGVNNFISGTYDVGATDAPMPTELWQKATALKGSVITIPDIVGSEAIIFNIPGFDPSKNGNLNLTASILARIYLGQISYWDDPSIKSLNPGFNFPHQKITAVHRSDGSGTTFVFTVWLYLTSIEWKTSGVGYGYTVNWPVDKLGGLGGKGNEGVTAYVKQTEFSIGYVEVQYAIANNLETAAIENPSGKFVLPNSNSISLALLSLDITKFPQPTQDWSNITALLLNSQDPNSYPIVTFSYLVIQKNYSDLNKAAGIYAFLNYIFTEGQSNGNIVTGYLPLPTNVQNYVLNEIKLISYNSQPVYQLISS